MNKVVQILASVLLCLSFAGGVASAQEVCSIEGTGPGSNNTCTIDENDNVVVNCSNGIVVTNSNGQVSTTGAANNANNTSSVGAYSGDAENLSEVVTELNTYCDLAVATTPQTPETPVTKVAQAEKSTPAAPQTQAPKGAVEAGAGGASKADNTAASLGLAASIGAIIGGVALVRKFAE